MTGALGPHTLTCIAPDGTTGEIRMEIQPATDRSTNITGDVFVYKEASIKITSPWFDRTIKLSADDDLQLIFRLLKVADIYIQKICTDNRYEVYKYSPGDVKGDFGVY